MPEKFRAIGMPPFWMSYVRVVDIHATVLTARERGGTVEVQPEPGPDGSLIALIRDPAGAGLTCHQARADGPLLAGPHTLRHELHVSDRARVEPFYGAVFGWTTRPTDRSDRYRFVDPEGRTVAGLQVTPDALKGDKEYWGVYFPAADLPAASDRIEKIGGRVITAQPRGDRDALLAEDSQGAAFYLIATAGVPPAAAAAAAAKFRWRAWVGLALVALAIVLDLNRLWGLLFLLWVLPDLRRGSTHFLEAIDRKQHPVTYWTVVTTWLALSFYLLTFGGG